MTKCLVALLLSLACSVVRASTLDTAPMPVLNLPDMLNCEVTYVGTATASITVEIINTLNGAPISAATCSATTGNRYCHTTAVGPIGPSYCEITVNGAKDLVRGALHFVNGTTFDITASEDAY